MRRLRKFLNYFRLVVANYEYRGLVEGIDYFRSGQKSYFPPRPEDLARMANRKHELEVHISRLEGEIYGIRRGTPTIY